MHIAMTVGDMDPGKGGPPSVVAGSAVALARRGHRVTIFAGQAGEAGQALAPRFAGLPVRIEQFDLDAPAKLARSSLMVRSFAGQLGTIDALHVHGIWEGHLAQLAAVARKAGKGVFVSSHGMLDSWSMDQSALKKRLALALTGTGTMLRHADAIILGTEDESAEARAVVPHTRHAIVPNGIDAAAIVQDIASQQPDVLREMLPVICNWQRTILYFGRIHPKKGLELLVQAFAQVKDSHPDAGLLVVGIAEDAGFLAQINQMVSDFGLEGRVAITTQLTGPGAKVAFAVADVFALPSRQEGFSMAIVEAMAAGKPLLITDKCHMGEVPGWGAGVVVPDSVAGLRLGLEQMLGASDEALQDMGRKASAVAQERFEWSSIAARLEALYRRDPA